MEQLSPERLRKVAIFGFVVFILAILWVVAKHIRPIEVNKAFATDEQFLAYLEHKPSPNGSLRSEIYFGRSRKNIITPAGREL